MLINILTLFQSCIIILNMLIGCGVMNSTIVVLIVFISLFLFICACGMLKKIFGEECISDYCNISVIVLYGNENIKLKLNHVVNKMQWIDEDLINKIILIDGGLNIEQKELCNNYCHKYDFLEFTTPDSLNDMIFNLQKNN